VARDPRGRDWLVVETDLEEIPEDISSAVLSLAQAQQKAKALG
jgi:hypothetical protein